MSDPSKSYLFELPASAQEVFSLVKEHARKGQRSVAPFRNHITGEVEIGGSYRGPNGAKCFAGILIPDDVFDQWFENKPWSFLVEKYNFPPQHRALIQSLQFLHDFEEVKQWDSGFSAIAQRFGLKNE